MNYRQDKYYSLACIMPGTHIFFPLSLDQTQTHIQNPLPPLPYFSASPPQQPSRSDQLTPACNLPTSLPSLAADPLFFSHSPTSSCPVPCPLFWPGPNHPRVTSFRPRATTARSTTMSAGVSPTGSHRLNLLLHRLNLIVSIFNCFFYINLRVKYVCCMVDGIEFLIDA